MSADRTKRIWVYWNSPKAFEVAPCECGNIDTQWSVFEGHCWCDRCYKDFVPDHHGILDGPIPVGAASMSGVRFDRLILATQEIEYFDTELGEYRPPIKLIDVLARSKPTGAAP